MSMMMPGHTHEDIDAVFGLISDQWSSEKKVLTPSNFTALIQVCTIRLLFFTFNSFLIEPCVVFCDHYTRVVLYELNASLCFYLSCMCGILYRRERCREPSFIRP